MTQLFDRIFSIFSIEYIFIVIVASYLVIKTVDYFNGERVVPTWAKRLITFLVGAASFVLFKGFTEVTFERLLSSYLGAVFIYDAAIKYLLKVFGVDYKGD